MDRHFTVKCWEAVMKYKNYPKFVFLCKAILCGIAIDQS